MAHCQKWFYDPCLASATTKHITMANYNDGDDDGDDDRNEDVNEDRNDDKNAASGSGSYGLMFEPITTPQSLRGSSDKDGNGTMDALQYISTLLKMCHKIL